MDKTMLATSDSDGKAKKGQRIKSMNLFISGGLTRGLEPLFLRTEMFPLQSVFLEKVNQVPTFGYTNMFSLRLRMHLRDCS